MIILAEARSDPDRRVRNDMRVLHVNDIASVASDLCAVQRSLGHESSVMAHRRYSMVEPDIPLILDGYLGINVELLARSRSFKMSDVVHIHGGIRRSQIAFRMLRRGSKSRWLIHYHGSETRMGYGMHHSDLADATIVSTPDLLRWHPGAIWLPNPIPEVLLPPARDREGNAGALVIGHFPSKRHLKGTESIIETLRPFTDSGAVELVIKEGRPHAEIIDTMRCVDVVVDQLTDLSIFSKVALEAMALGVPAISSYDRSLFPGDCPVLAANSGVELAEVVQKIVKEGVEERLKRDSVEYVRRYHDPIVVAKRLDEVYRSAS